MAERRPEWFLNTVTGEPELGKQSPADRRMGPYQSYEEALNAWKIAKKRNKAWEEEDRRWRQEWEGGTGVLIEGYREWEELGSLR